MRLSNTLIKLSLVGVLASLAACAGPSGPRDSVLSGTTNRCAIAPHTCLYKGNYEPGERAYAERAAADLNRQQSVRMRRASYFH